MDSVSWVDIGIILVYLAGMVAVGIWTSRKVKNLTDYSLAGKSLGYLVMIGTLVGAAIGAASTMGKAGKAYELGIIFVTAGFGYIAGLVVFGLLSSRLRRLGIWTIPEALYKRYGKGINQACGAAMFITVIALFGGQIIGIGLIFTAVGQSLGLTYTTSIILAGVVMILYTVLGGLFAVAYTDLIQTVIMVVSIGVILPIFILANDSGSILAGAWQTAATGTGQGISVIYLISIWIIDFCFCLVDPGLWQRANAANSGKVIRNSMFVTAGVYLYWSVVVVLLGLLGIFLIPNIVQSYGSADAVIPVMIVKYMPVGLVGLCLAGLMAVMMSTASVALLISGTTIANDLIKAARPQTSETRLLLWAKLVIVLVGALGIVFAMVMRGIFDILLLAFAVYVSAVFIPAMAAFFWKKATRQGAIVSSIVSTIVCVALYAVKQFVEIPWLEPIVISLAVSLILMWTVSRATYKPESATPKLILSGGHQ
ncbi:MAG: sodium:solute symporter family protein [Dehalococcoidia bacterium]|nr:sodium:solute symporter family protein [Dehalococcoidia bacterium]